MGYDDVVAMLALVLEKAGPVTISWKDLSSERPNELELGLKKAPGSDDVVLSVQAYSGTGSYAKVNGVEETLVQNPQEIILVPVADDYSDDEYID